MELVTFIKHFESYSPTVYICPGGARTIGYGHVLTPGEKMTRVTAAKASDMLQNDLLGVRYGLARLIRVPLKPYQMDALTSFAFNAGVGAFQASRLRQCVNGEEHEEAAEEFLRWVYAGGQKLNGFVKRRTLESYWYQNKLKGFSVETSSVEGSPA